MSRLTYGRVVGGSVHVVTPSGSDLVLGPQFFPKGIPRSPDGLVWGGLIGDTASGYEFQAFGCNRCAGEGPGDDGGTVYLCGTWAHHVRGWVCPDPANPSGRPDSIDESLTVEEGRDLIYPDRGEWPKLGRIEYTYSEVNTTDGVQDGGRETEGVAGFFYVSPNMTEQDRQDVVDNELGLEGFARRDYLGSNLGGDPPNAAGVGYALYAATTGQFFGGQPNQPVTGRGYPYVKAYAERSILGQPTLFNGAVYDLRDIDTVTGTAYDEWLSEFPPPEPTPWADYPCGESVPATNTVRTVQRTAGQLSPTRFFVEYLQTDVREVFNGQVVRESRRRLEYTAIDPTPYVPDLFIPPPGCPPRPSGAQAPPDSTGIAEHMARDPMNNPGCCG